MERELQEEVILDLPGLLALCLRKGIWILLGKNSIHHSIRL